MLQPDGRFKKVRQSFNEPGQAHELTFSCYKRLPLLSKDRTRVWFIEALEQARRTWKFDVWAYVIMPEHVLLFPREGEYDISNIIKSIKQSVARKAIDWLKGAAPEWLPKLEVPGLKERVEHRFWEAGGGYDRNVYEPTVAWSSVDYIHRNPVRRGLVKQALEWEWSSARFYAGWADVRLRMDGQPPHV